MTGRHASSPGGNWCRHDGIRGARPTESQGVFDRTLWRPGSFLRGNAPALGQRKSSARGHRSIWKEPCSDACVVNWRPGLGWLGDRRCDLALRDASPRPPPESSPPELERLGASQRPSLLIMRAALLRGTVAGRAAPHTHRFSGRLARRESGERETFPLHTSVASARRADPGVVVRSAAARPSAMQTHPTFTATPIRSIRWLTRRPRQCALPCGRGRHVVRPGTRRRAISPVGDGPDGRRVLGLREIAPSQSDLGLLRWPVPESLRLG